MKWKHRHNWHHPETEDGAHIAELRICLKCGATQEKGSLWMWKRISVSEWQSTLSWKRSRWKRHLEAEEERKELLESYRKEAE